MSSYLKVNDRKWRALKRQLGLIPGAAVTVGVQSDAGASQDGTPLASIAAFNEFGTRGGAAGGGWGGPIPPRPFLGSTTDERKRPWGRAADVAISQALASIRPFPDGLKILGELAQMDIQQKITSIATPPNSLLTIEIKGSSNPLINTGALRQSIRYEVKL